MLFASSFEGMLDSAYMAVIADFAQELLILVIFGISFTLWRNLTALGNPRQMNKKKANAMQKQNDSMPKKGESAPLAPLYLSKPCPQPKEELSPTKQEQLQRTQQQVLKMLKEREFTRALNMFRSLEKEGLDRFVQDEELFSTFIQSAIRVGKTDVVERLVRLMKRNNVVLSLEFWQVVMKMLSGRKYASCCLALHSICGKHLPVDKVVYSCLVNSALEAKQSDRAIQMLNKYSESNLTASDYILFFRVYVAVNDLASAQAVFEKLGAEVTTLMLNLLLLITVNTKQPEIGWDHVIACHELENSTQRRIVDSISYNTIMKGFAQNGKPHKAFECLFAMRQHGLEPDDVTFGTLLEACIASNNMGAANEVVNLMIAGEKPMDTVMCTLFIKGLVRNNCFEKAVELYEEMKRRNETHPDIITYSVLIKAFVDCYKLDQALKLVDDMRHFGLPPDDIILTHLLEGCRHAGNHKLGKQLFNEIISNDVTPSDYTLITMVKLHGKCGAHAEAYELVSTWYKKYNTKPSVIHYTCLMSGCIRTKDYRQAWAAYKLMCENGIQPDETTVSTLLPGLVASRQWDNVLVLAKRALDGPKPMSVIAPTLNNALAQMQTEKDINLAEQLRMLMVKAKIRISARSA